MDNPLGYVSRPVSAPRRELAPMQDARRNPSTGSGRNDDQGQKFSIIDLTTNPTNDRALARNINREWTQIHANVRDILLLAFIRVYSRFSFFTDLGLACYRRFNSKLY